MQRGMNVTPSVIIFSLCVLGAGCSGPGGISTVEVTGQVRLQDKPLDDAIVAFMSEAGARFAEAKTDAAGEFKIRVAPGKNLVSISKPGPAPAIAPTADNGPQLMPDEAEHERQVKALASSHSTVPPRYANPKTSGLAFDVAKGMSKLQIDLSPK